MVKPTVTPIAQNQTNQCSATPPWFVHDSEYNVLPGKFELLINGENAFRAVYDVIASAEKSVCIICWGFQPSMYFKRGSEAGRMIGELLEEKAQHGIKVRVLSWKMEFDVVPGIVRADVSPTGLSGEANTPGRRAVGIKDKPATMSGKAFDYNQEWFMRYDTDQGLVYDKGARTLLGLDGKPKTKNIQFVGRGFSAVDRKAIASSRRADSTTSATTRTFQAGAASHHQKMVLVDFEVADKAIGFVMGHNMLDEYWDRSDHSYKRCADPRQGRNGSRPREDFSSRVSGPLLGDLFHNFNAAWKKETGEDLAKSVGKLAFEKYPLSAAGKDAQDEATRVELAKARQATDRECAFQEANKFDFSETGKKAITDSKVRQKASEAHEMELEAELDAPRSKAAPVAETGTAIMGQILRTQPQYGKRDIAACYLQAVNNATQYIYIENQYFRWPVLAEKLTAHVKILSESGRDPAKYGSLYLFGITNADSEGMGKGTVNTARMMENLGRADTLPEVNRQQRAEDTAAELKRTEQEIRSERVQQNQLTPLVTRDTSARTKLEESRFHQQAAKTRKTQLQQKLADQQKDQKDNRRAIAQENRPGLKVLMCTLVAPDSPGRRGTALATGDRALTREERIEAVRSEIGKTDADLNRAQQTSDMEHARQDSLKIGIAEGDAQAKKDYEASRVRLHASSARENELTEKRSRLKKELAELQDGGNAVDWVDVYIHAKLMLIDDTFMTVGSANINSRSMETDSELNIAHANHLITRPARKFLWHLHTNGRSGGEAFSKQGMIDAYDNWTYVMKKNKTARKDGLAPTASLVEFFSATKERTDLD